jgi:hypothetical protein
MNNDSTTNLSSFFEYYKSLRSFIQFSRSFLFNVKNANKFIKPSIFKVSIILNE